MDCNNNTTGASSLLVGYIFLGSALLLAYIAIKLGVL